MKQNSYETKPQAQRCAVLHVELPEKFAVEHSTLRSPVARLDEAINLTSALGLDIAYTDVITLKKVNPKTLIGGGKVEELLPILDKEGVSVVVVNASLTPTQQRNLEVVLDAKVVDRTHLILEIFADRAQTKAGRLQVALAQQQYLQGRLVRAWTHLERQRGGLGKTGGPGERQIELDRRMIADKVKLIKEDLSSVEKERELQRKARERRGLPVVSLVGYTNAGKSTLFNALLSDDRQTEKQDAFVKDMLFATLDPLMRKISLPSGREIILSDTVGFVSDLPHQLVESFKSTLEEVRVSNLILHVHDASSEDVWAQHEDVMTVLKSIKAHEQPMLNVLNKSDLGVSVREMDGDEDEDVHSGSLDWFDSGVKISAITGEGIDPLLAEIDRLLSLEEDYIELEVHASEGRKIAFIYEKGKIVSQELDGDVWRMKVRMSKENSAKLWSL